MSGDPSHSSRGAGEGAAAPLAAAPAPSAEPATRRSLWSSQRRISPGYPTPYPKGGARARRSTLRVPRFRARSAATRAGLVL